MVKPKRGETGKAAPKDIKAEQKSESKMETQAAPTVATTESQGMGHAVTKGLKMLAGIIIGLIGLFLLWYWWGPFAVMFKGLIGPAIMLLGLIVLVLGWTD